MEPARGLTRRTFLARTAAVAAGTALSGLPLAAPAGALPGWPTFTYLREAVDRDALRYNPTGEIMFPSIRRVGDRVANPLGRYYLYYSPHDAPGGICLAYADSLAGPFTEYARNPIVARIWSPHYSVSHVASPHVLWNELNATLYLYFHGENNTTRLARSRDGITWTYDSVILTTAQLPAGVTETSYARAFRHTIPARGNIYVLLFMGNQSGTRKVFLAWSDDQRNWTVQQRPLVSPAPDGETQIGNPHLLLKDGVPHIAYNGSSGPMYVTRVGANFDQEVHLGVLHRPMAGFPDNGRSASPAFAKEGDTVYMYYEAGTRLDGRIAVATGAATPGITYPT